MEEQYKKLTEEIRQKSKECLIAWTPSNYNDTYEATLGRGAILIEHNEPSEEYYPETPVYSLSFLNERGEVFHSIKVFHEFVDTDKFQCLKDIYEYAYKSYMKIDETLKSMFEDINSK